MPLASIPSSEKENINKLYWQDGLTIRQIAEKYGAGYAPTHRFFIRHNIPRRKSDYERTPEIRQKMADTRVRLGIGVGADNPRWKGGIATNANDRAITGIGYWKATVKRRDGNICQLCGLDGNIACNDCKRKPVMHIDHIKPWKEFPELRLDVSNGRVLCADCHYSTLRKSGELLGPPNGKAEGNQQPSQA